MKASVSLVISFVFLCVVGTAACAALYMVSLSLHSFVAGGGLELASRGLFVRGAFYSAPGVCVASLVLLVLRIIRRRDVSAFGSVLSFVLYVLIGCTVWGVALPRLFSLEAGLAPDEGVPALSPATPGYFRVVEDSFVYYSRVLPDGTADGIRIGRFGGPGSVGRFSGGPAAACDEPYSDVLVRDAVRPSPFAARPVRIYEALLSAAREGWRGGRGGWLEFASMGLALLSLYSLRFSSRWRLWCASFVVVGALAVVCVNYAFVAGKIPAVPGIPFVGGFIDGALANLPAFVRDRPPAVCVNVLVAGALSVYGAGCAVVGTIRGRAEEGEE